MTFFKSIKLSPSSFPFLINVQNKIPKTLGYSKFDNDTKILLTLKGQTISHTPLTTIDNQHKEQ